jgi:hypothetical protein
MGSRNRVRNTLLAFRLTFFGLLLPDVFAAPFFSSGVFLVY